MAADPNNQSTKFECSVCAFDKDEPHVVIESDPICHECIVDSIIPKFHAALQHESNYPVIWSGLITLNHKDLSEFFEDYDTFRKQWEIKEQEYKTPGKDRLHCRDCSSFLGERRSPIAPDMSDLVPLVRCPTCVGWVCGRCGSVHGLNDCAADEEDDPIKDMEGYQRCVNEDCSTILFLQDGCNAVQCYACKAKFCWICKLRDPPHQHWDSGSSCPRFNKPGAANAIYNEQVDFFNANEPQQFDDGEITVMIPPHVLGVLEEWEIALFAGELMRTRADIDVLLGDLPGWAQPAGASDLQRQIDENDRRRDGRAPAETPRGLVLEWTDQANRANRLLDERNRHAVLEMTPQGVIMVRHQHSLREMHQDVHRYRQELLDQGRMIPLWLDAVVHLTMKLMASTNAYVYRAQFEASLAEFTQRHEEIMDLWPGAMSREAVRRYPDLVVILTIHEHVVQVMLEDAWAAAVLQNGT